MADNVTFQSGTAATPPASTVVATDDVSSVQYQIVKLDGGGDGLSARILGDSANGLDVDVTRLPVTAPTAANQVTGNTSLASIDGKLPAGGVATEATLAGIKAGTDKIPASPATETTLALIKTDADRLDITLSALRDAITKTGATAKTLADVVAALASVPVTGTLGATQSGTWTVQPGNTQNSTPWLMQPSAQEIHLGEIGANSAVITPTLTVSTSAYASGNVVGGKLTLTNAMRKSGGTGVLQSFFVIDQSSTPQNLPLDILIFNQDPTNGTYTDRTAFTLNATDAGFCVRRLAVATGDYKTLGGIATADIAAIAKVVAAVGSANLYMIMVAGGAATYSATTALTVRCGLLRD